MSGSEIVSCIIEYLSQYGYDYKITPNSKYGIDLVITHIQGIDMFLSFGVIVNPKEDDILLLSLADMEESQVVQKVICLSIDAHLFAEPSSTSVFLHTALVNFAFNEMYKNQYSTSVRITSVGFIYYSPSYTDLNIKPEIISNTDDLSYKDLQMGRIQSYFMPKCYGYIVNDKNMRFIFRLSDINDPIIRNLFEDEEFVKTITFGIKQIHAYYELKEEAKSSEAIIHKIVVR